MHGQRLFRLEQRPPLPKATRERIVRWAFGLGCPLMLLLVVNDVFLS